MTNYACDRACKYCVVTGRCPRIRQSVPSNPAKVRERKWNPNDGSEDATLKCGDTIPWPVIRGFAGDIRGRIWCSEHGWQPALTEKQIEAAKEKRRKADRRTGTLEGLNDKPPF